MSTTKRGTIRTTGTSRRCCAIIMAWLFFSGSRPAFSADPPPVGDVAAPAFSPSQISDPSTGDASAVSQPDEAAVFLGTASPGVVGGQPAPSLRLAPISFGFGGSLGYDIEQRTRGNSDPQQRQRMVLNLNALASSYIWQPWIAQISGNLGLIASKSLTNDIGISRNTFISGAKLGLVPYSRYPFKAEITRNQQNEGSGIGSPLSHTTRLNLNQRYIPRHRKEFYEASYVHSQTDGGIDSSKNTGLGFNMSSARFKNHSFDVDGNRQRETRLDESKIAHSSQARIRHRYRPGGGLSIENNASMVSSIDREPSISNVSRTRELNSTLSLQPLFEPYSVIGSARVHVSDLDSQLISSQTRIANANLSANYRPNQYIRLSAGGNVNVTNSERTYSLTAAQSATLVYPLAAISLDGWRYSPRISGSISNSTRSNSGKTGSTQNVTITPSHALNSDRAFGGGRLALGLDQSLALSESTRSQANSKLSHSVSSSWRRQKGSSDTSLRFLGRDTRSLSISQDIFQSLYLNANIGEEFSRDSKLTGDLSVQTTRQITPIKPDSSITNISTATLRYSHQRAFNTPRLIFDSEVRVYSKAFFPVLAGTPEEQGPITWENMLSYSVGRLVANFRVNLSKTSDGTTQSLIALSLKRFF